VGKLAEEDVQEFLKEFAALDYDEDGSLNVSDVHISSLVKDT
jgi:Ca2+-binding EF-hand superfamily protein